MRAQKLRSTILILASLLFTPLTPADVPTLNDVVARFASADPPAHETCAGWLDELQRMHRGLDRLFGTEARARDFHVLPASLIEGSNAEYVHLQPGQAFAVLRDERPPARARPVHRFDALLLRRPKSWLRTRGWEPHLYWDDFRLDADAASAWWADTPMERELRDRRFDYAIALIARVRAGSVIESIVLDVRAAGPDADTDEAFFNRRAARVLTFPARR